MRVEGECFGRLCQRVGLTESARISDAQFERVGGNHHAETGEKLTERMAAGRRAGYALLLKLELSIDQRTLELGFATHTVTVSGWDLQEVYEAVADGHARCIRVSERVTPGSPVRQDDRAVVAEIRIAPLDPDDRRRR